MANGKQSSRKRRSSDRKSEVKNAEDVRQLAEKLQKIAARIVAMSELMAKYDIQQIRPLVGSYSNSLDELEKFVVNQLFSKIICEASNLGHDFNEVLEATKTGAM